MSRAAQQTMPSTSKPALSEHPSRILLRARIVVPVARDPIPNGAIIINGSRIEAVGSWPRLRRRCADVLDLGEVAILPGLINAHCHLDYTKMAGQLPPPKHFPDWLKSITSIKAGWNKTDYAESWTEGAKMLLHTGTTTVADTEAVPELLPEVWDTTPLRVFSFIEMIGITARRKPRAILKQATDLIASLEPKGHLGLSPHAPYTTLPTLLRLTGSAARKHRWRVATHVAESATEFEMFTEAKGEMFDWLKRSSREMADCRGRSPVEHLEDCGLLGRNLLAIHANYLQEDDISLLHRRRVNVVHCPRSHAYFRHAPFRLKALLEAGVNVCLGTDSLASVCTTRKQKVTLNMLDEMRSLAKAHDFVAPSLILRMATVNGALALGMEGRIGELTRGACADLIVLPGAARIADVHEMILGHTGKVFASMIRGEWTLAPSEN
jgi:cytosine/adenosine deaminase-related metal-dependent hydrolase